MLNYTLLVHSIIGILQPIDSYLKYDGDSKNRKFKFVALILFEL